MDAVFQCLGFTAPNVLLLINRDGFDLLEELAELNSTSLPLLHELLKQFYHLVQCSLHQAQENMAEASYLKIINYGHQEHFRMMK